VVLFCNSSALLFLCCEIWARILQISGLVEVIITDFTGLLVDVENSTDYFLQMTVSFWICWKKKCVEKSKAKKAIAGYEPSPLTFHDRLLILGTNQRFFAYIGHQNFDYKYEIYIMPKK